MVRARQVVKALNVAEKPSVAKEVSRILSRGTAQMTRTCAQYNGLYRFPMTINGTAVEMLFTSVSGHLMELEFTEQYTSWRGCSPLDLYNAPVIKRVPQDKQPIKQNLEQLSREAQWLILWLDCDREGENIAFEVIQVCTAVNPRLQVKRARFSALIERDLHCALNTLQPPNADESAAVDARQELDLRIGASFTRFQSLLLQNEFDWLAAGMHAERPLISYGPCQFPTLGLIVQRAWEIAAHVPETFWHIMMIYRDAASQHVQFQWARGRLYDHACATLLYERTCRQPAARVASVVGKQRPRYPPHPLSTLDMQKRATSYMRMSGERIMKIAEELYQAGFISYPRTETDMFDRGYDLEGMVAQYAQHPEYGAYAQRLLSGELWQRPRGGGHDDNAHPPIHPTRCSTGEPDWPPDKKRLYDFVVRHFLACCSKPAQGYETKVTAVMGDEAFVATGLMVKEQSWLQIYPWVRWQSAASLPVFVEGQAFVPTTLMLEQGSTQPPPRLSERDLIAKMEQHGIGTDATVAEHIQKQIDRGYAIKDGQLLFEPTPLGEALVAAYCAMQLENLWKPDLRGVIERNITAIARRQRSMQQVLTEGIAAFRSDLQDAIAKQGVMSQEVGRFFPRRAGEDDGVPRAALGPCPQCGSELALYAPVSGQAYVACRARTLCKSRLTFPHGTLRVEVTSALCTQCPPDGQLRLLACRFRAALVPPGLDPETLACIQCHGALRNAMQVGGGSGGSTVSIHQRTHRAVPPQQQPVPAREGGRAGRGGGRGQNGATTGGRRRGRGSRGGRGGRGGRNSSTLDNGGAFGNAVGGNTTGLCFVCQQPGHWASLCPSRGG